MPHNGTRTLVEHTGLSAREHGFRGGRWWHFGNCEELLRAHRIHAHIPIRNPLDVARSWAQRKKTGDVLANMLSRYAEMFAFLEAGDIPYTLYRVEDLPRLAGTGEHEGALETSEKITEFQDAVRKHVIAPHRDFFLRFYKPQELA